MKMRLVFGEQLLYPLVPLQKSEAGHGGTGHQGHLGFADVVADDRWHWHGHRSVGTVSAPIQSHLHPSASTRSNGWTLCVCVCVCVCDESALREIRSTPTKVRTSDVFEISSYDLCKRRASMKLKPRFFIYFFRRKTHLGWYFYHNGKLI